MGKLSNLTAADHVRADEADNEHMDAEGHCIFASAMLV